MAQRWTDVQKLAVGQTYIHAAEGFTITVTSPIEGGITIRVTRTAGLALLLDLVGR